MSEQNVNQLPPKRRPIKQSFIPDNPNQPLLHIPTNTQCIDAFQGHTYRGSKGLELEGIRMIIFPFSLKGNARLWYNSMPASSIYT
jgi:hypothetical protein